MQQQVPALASSLIETFFRRSAGQWQSERRYYTLPAGETQEMVSVMTIEFLAEGSPELLHLAQLHQLPTDIRFSCGAAIAWESNCSILSDKPSHGSTLFGVYETTLYRDRGFATPKPVTAEFYFPEPETLCLRTEYNGSVFEESLKLVGRNYRTRQTIISRAGEEQMIGQYLERRIESTQEQ